MHIEECNTGLVYPVQIQPVTAADYGQLTRSKFHFNWSTEKPYLVYKLVTGKEILGLVSLEDFPDEKRMEIRLLAVSRENTGPRKRFDRIAGNLVSWACREAIKRYADNACISLVPKTRLAPHYKKKYGMLEAGRQLYLDDGSLLYLLLQYT